MSSPLANSYLHTSNSRVEHEFANLSLLCEGHLRTCNEFQTNYLEETHQIQDESARQVLIGEQIDSYGQLLQSDYLAIVGRYLKSPGFMAFVPSHSSLIAFYTPCPPPTPPTLRVPLPVAHLIPLPFTPVS